MIKTLAAVALAAALAAPALAAPEEIQVYLDDVTTPGRFGVDVHANDAVKAAPPESAGLRDPEHVFRLTPEFYYGLNSRVELGLYVLTAYAPDGGAVFDGGKARVKYVAAHDPKEGPFWGANIETGRTNRTVSELAWNAELKGILGCRVGRWTFAADPNLDTGLGRARLGDAGLEVDSKIAFEIARDAAVGLESYDELGPASAPGALPSRGHTLYAAFDGAAGGVDLNAAVGRGLTPAADPWTIKLIVGLRY